MKLKPYLHYKDTGIGWLGSVPTEWELRRIKFTLVEKKKTENTELQSGAISYGEVITKDDESILAETRQSYQEVLIGEYLINPINLNYDLKSLRTALSKINVCVSPAYIVTRLSDERVDCNYLKYLLYQFDIAHMKTLGAGVRQTIKYSDIGNCFWCLPNAIEQRQIATFLDRETTKLDTLISKQEKLIELLKEKRQAVISHAVTKGLDPDVSMKDSGVEWLGDVPEHWQMTPMRFVSNLNPPVSFNEVNEDDELIFLPMDQIKNGFHLLNRAPLSNLNSSYNTFEKGDILLAKVTPCFENGNIAIAEGKGFGTSEIFVLRPTSIDSRLFYWYLQSDFFKMDGVASMTGAGGLKRVSSDVPQKHHIPKPPMNEQTTIANYIDQKTNKIDNLIEKTKRSIELAKEHRTALISAAVTGKIDVRDQVPEASYA